MAIYGASIPEDIKPQAGLGRRRRLFDIKNRGDDWARGRYHPGRIEKGQIVENKQSITALEAAREIRAYELGLF